ncbi:hypothetical protein OCU04_007154 [Sclerotinia nivalis]|uniref:Uncharacterized protein n=1 Tax=Sclerotinia nivalis TaxID=352851 RepID=A0A9X0DJN3_9HELO|nr:hypothetical protein OCU04_007154 [Sclerotinia nivalis]
MASGDVPLTELAAGATSPQICSTLGIHPHQSSSPLKYVFTDPSIDTIYFGQNTCLGTMCCFVDSLVRTKKQLSRVAINCVTDRRRSCMGELGYLCSCVTGGALTIPYQPFNGNILSNNEVLLSFGLNSLHGMQMDKLPNFHDGWPNLEEIILCVSLFPHVDESITLRPAMYTGKYYERRDIHNFRSIQYLERGESQFAKWVPGSRPKFHFASLSKRAEPGKVFDLLVLEPAYRPTLSNQEGYVNDLKRLSNPHCQLRLQRPPRGSCIDIEFYGTEEGVFAAKKACLTQPGSVEERDYGDILRQMTDDQWNEWNFQFAQPFHD